MKHIKKLGIVLLFSVLLCGCKGNKKAYTYTEPEKSIIIEMYDWQSEGVEETAFVYDGREYIFYAYVNERILEEDVKQCVGRFSYDGELLDDVLLTLTYNDSNDYLAGYITTPSVMYQGGYVYRAVDTRGENAEPPDFAEEPPEWDPNLCQFWLNEDKRSIASWT